MIDVRDVSVKCEIFNIDDVEFIINDLCIKLIHFINIYFYHFLKSVNKDVLII